MAHLTATISVTDLPEVRKALADAERIHTRNARLRRELAECRAELRQLRAMVREITKQAAR